MTIQLLGLGGEPASGKTSIMVEVMARLSEAEAPKEISLELCRGLCWTKAKVIVLGLYDGSLFQGTDKLSMAVQPCAVKFLRALESTREDYDGVTVLFEGDRLYTVSFLAECRALLGDRARFWLLSASHDARRQRHPSRKDTQSSTWLKSRATKAANLAAQRFVEVKVNEVPQDRRQLIAEILEFAGVVQSGPVNA